MWLKEIESYFSGTAHFQNQRNIHYELNDSDGYFCTETILQALHRRLTRNREVPGSNPEPLRAYNVEVGSDCRAWHKVKKEWKPRDFRMGLINEAIASLKVLAKNNLHALLVEHRSRTIASSVQPVNDYVTNGTDVYKQTVHRHS